jgi:hypothetical protein
LTSRSAARCVSSDSGTSFSVGVVVWEVEGMRVVGPVSADVEGVSGRRRP